MNAVGQQEFEPRSNVLPNVDGEVLVDEVVIIRSSGLPGESEVFQPYSRVRLPSVLDDVDRWSKAWWECRFLNAAPKGLWTWSVWTGASVAVPVPRSASLPGVRLHVLLLRLVGLRHARGGLANIGITAGQLPRVDDATCIVVGPEPSAYWQALGQGTVRPQHRNPPGMEALATGGLRGLVSASLLYGGMLHQRLDVAVDLLLLGYCRLGHIA
jgi:hypothetical protein